MMRTAALLFFLPLLFLLLAASLPHAKPSREEGLAAWQQMYSVLSHPRWNAGM